MKLYVSQGTNPRVVELFLSEKGIEIDRVWVDIARGENRKQAFLDKNPLGELPVLELDSGQCISQITAICEYLEELSPDPPMIGVTPEQRAETRMWLRRNDLLIIEPMISAFKYSEGLFYYQSLVHCVPQAVDDFKEIARRNIAWLDKQMASRRYLCGERFSLADTQLFCFLDFGRQSGQPVATENGNILAWFDRVKARYGITDDLPRTT